MNSGRVEIPVVICTLSLPMENPLQSETDPNELTSMGIQLLQTRQFEQALSLLNRAIETRPGNGSTHQAIGDAHMGLHQTDAAARAFKQALAIDPDLANAHMGLGFAQRSLGQFAEAGESFRRALRISPGNVMIYTHLAGTGVAGEPEIAQLQALLASGKLNPDERLAAGFALGKFLDDSGQYDDAFAHFAAANAAVKVSCQRQGRGFSAALLQAEVDRKVQTFNASFFRAVEQWGNASDLPVFVVGMPRSGTSLVEQILASHSKVFGAGELSDIDSLARKFPPIVTPGTPPWDPMTIKREADLHLQRLQERGPAASRVVDKLPANLFHLGLIATLFPNARVLLCRRDPRDTCLSCYFQWFANNGLPFSYDLKDCATQSLEQERLEAHWLEHLPLRILPVQYEDLVADLETHSRRMVDFLGLEWEPECLAFHTTQRNIRTASVWQVRQPIYNSSVGKWRHYEKHLGPLLKMLDPPQNQSSGSLP